MRFKIDENLPPEAAMLLREAGPDALTVWDQGMQGATDRVLMDVCRQETRSLLTLDLDFADIRRYPPADHPGIIIFRLKTQARTHVLAVLGRMISILDAQSPAGQLWLVTEQGIRIHGSEE